MKKLLKRLFYLLCILIVVVILFIKFYAPFGASPNKTDKKDYALRSEIFKSGLFENTGDFSVMGEWEDPYKDRSTNKGTKPEQELPYKEYTYQEANKDDVLITWFGHSSVLIQIQGKNILVDPIFEDIASPVSFVGSNRFSPVPVKIENLPKIDAILLTHDHYDHESYWSLRALEKKTEQYIVPLGIEKDLEKFGIPTNKIQNKAWWEETKIDDLLIACTPSRHYSGRILLDKNDTLWSSWIIKSENYTIFDSGDTGYGDHFKTIYEKYGPIDFALLDGAQYDEKWHDVHMFPEEAVEAAFDVHAKLSMVQHYGAFTLSNHSWDDPVERFTRQAKEKNLEYITPILGESVNLKEYASYKNEWWKDIQ
ncbi:MAG: MBL fold metallo-hydrolase [Firmicutes bacterium]|nr:MBL fold metallo-hydrolase [Bacillota bacterium]